MVQTMVAVFEQMSHVISIVLPLRPPNTTIPSSTGLEIPTTHQCTDTRDGNYTCTGSMKGEYSQFYTNYITCTGSTNGEYSQFCANCQNPWTRQPAVNITRQYRPRRGRESFQWGERGGPLIVGDGAGGSPAYFKTVTEVNNKDSNEVRFQSLLPDHGPPPSPLWTDTQNCESITSFVLRTRSVMIIFPSSKRDLIPQFKNNNMKFSSLGTHVGASLFVMLAITLWWRSAQHQFHMRGKFWLQFVITTTLCGSLDHFLCYTYLMFCYYFSLFRYNLPGWHLGLDRGVRM